MNFFQCSRTYKRISYSHSYLLSILESGAIAFMTTERANAVLADVVVVAAVFVAL